MVLNETYTLANGIEIPKLGFGTWMIEGDACVQAVKDAIEVGYRHIDTAEGYGNEREVGKGIRESGVPREQIFLTTKLEAAYKTYEEAKAGIEKSLADLDLDYIDLMIIHSPQPWDHFREGDRYFEGNLAAWRALEEAYEAGKVRAIGVSNFEAEDLDNLIENGTVKPMVNQILCHISNTPAHLIAACKERGVLVEAYSPVAHGAVMNNPEAKAVADRLGVSIPRLCIRYCLELGLLPLPKTANPAHMADNADVDFAIPAEDMEVLKAAKPITNYGDGAIFPVYGGKMDDKGNLTARDFVARA